MIRDVRRDVHGVWVVWVVSQIWCAPLAALAAKHWTRPGRRTIIAPMRPALFFVSAMSTLLIGSTAFAHHAMDGALPETLLGGLLSGLAHPVIGLDHLLAIIAVGLLSANVGTLGATFAAMFVFSGLLGTGIHLLRFDVPAAEVVVSATVVLLGLALFAQRRLPDGARALGYLAPIGLLTGAFHGYAYGESIVGAESAPLGGYLLGFTAVQLALIFGARSLGRAAAIRSPAFRARLRVFSGGVVSTAGAALLVIALRS